MEVSYFGSSIIKSHLQLLAASGELSAYPKIKVKLVSYFAEARWVINSGHYFDARAKKKKILLFSFCPSISNEKYISVD